MKQRLLSLLLLTSLSATAQPYDNITSDWCKMNLKGKVKEMNVTTFTSSIKKNKKKEYDNNLLISFSPDGYIIQKLLNKEKKKSTMTTYSYQHHNERDALAVVTYYHNKRRDSLENYYVPTSDTSFSIHYLSIWEDTMHAQRLPKYIYNSQQQLISADVSGSKKWGTITEVYQYNKQGQRIGFITTTSLTDSTSAVAYDIRNTDNKGNPTVVLETEQGLQQTHKKTKYITYTYYE